MLFYEKNALFGLTILVSLCLLLFACRKDIKFYLEDKIKAPSAMLESAKIWRLQRLDRSALLKTGRAVEILKPLWSDSWTINSGSDMILIVPAPERFQRNKNVQIHPSFVFKQNSGEISDGKIVEIVAKNYDLASNTDKILANLEEESNTDFNRSVLFYDINYRKVTGTTYQKGKKTDITTGIEVKRFSSAAEMASRNAFTTSSVCSPVFGTKVGWPLIVCDGAEVTSIADYTYNSDGCITAITYTYVNHSCPGDNTSGHGSGSGSGSGTGSSGNPDYGGGTPDNGCNGIAAAHTLTTQLTVDSVLTALNNYNVNLTVNNPNELEYGVGFYLKSNNNMSSGYKNPSTTPGNSGSWPPPPFKWNATDGYKILEAHTHLDGNGPSPSDVMYMAKDLADVPTSDKEFYKANVTSMVVTKYGNYLVRVKDWTGFLAEYNTYKNTPKQIYDDAYLDQIEGVAATGALFLKKFGAYLYLYKSNPGSTTTFSPLKILPNNGTGTVECPN